MKFFHVSIKGLKEIFRDRKGLGLLLAFPAIFMLVFGFAFSGGQGDNTPYNIGVINQDKGAKVATVDGDEEERNFGEDLVEVIEGLNYENSDVSMFDVRKVNPEEGDELLKDRDLAALVVIPPNFSAAINQLIKSSVRSEVTSRVGERIITEFTGEDSPNPEDFAPDGMDELPEGAKLPEAKNITAELAIKGDPGYVAYGQTRGILDGVINQYKNEVERRAASRTASFFDAPSEQLGEFLTVKSESISGSQSLSVFDYQAPGIFVFALLMSAIGVAGSLAGEVEAGTLERLKLSRMGSFDLLFGTLIPWSVLAVVQVLILFAVAMLIGFSWAGGITSLLLAVLVSIIAGVASVSLGLLIAAFADNEQHASNLGTLIAVPLSFIVGAFFPLPKVPIGQIFGETFEIYDFLPWSHAADALRSLLIFGGGISEIAVDIAFLVGLTILLFLVGVFFFSRTRLSASG